MRAYYDHAAEREWERLARPAAGAVEYAVNRHYIAAHLDELPPGARVLDIGGGPGRYALWLAGRGHRVTLADFSPELLAIARSRVVESPARALVEEIVEADARDLARWADGAFDAALSLGPFYHLPDPSDRERAAAELARVVRPGGLVFVALIPRYAFLRRALALADERRHLARPEFVARVLDDGAFVNELPGRFTGAWGCRPEDVAPFFERHGFNALVLLSSEGIAPDLQGALAELISSAPAAGQAALDLIIGTAADPNILGLGNHLLYIGRKAT